MIYVYYLYYFNRYSLGPVLIFGFFLVFVYGLCVYLYKCAVFGVFLLVAMGIFTLISRRFERFLSYSMGILGENFYLEGISTPKKVIFPSELNGFYRLPLFIGRFFHEKRSRFHK